MAAAIWTYNQTFIVNGAWLTPTLVLPARFAKLTAQVDFWKWPVTLSTTEDSEDTDGQSCTGTE